MTLQKGWFVHNYPTGFVYSPLGEKFYEHKKVPAKGPHPTTQEVVDFLNYEGRDWDIGVRNSVGIIYNRMSTSIAHKHLAKEDNRNELPSGTYQYVYDAYNYPYNYLNPISIKKETAVKRQTFHSMYEDIHSFLEHENLYKEIGILHKRGYLLYGDPGEGKTTIIQQILDKFKDSIVIFSSSTPSISIIENLQKYEKDRLKIFIFEELVSSIGNSQQEQEMLRFLDGERSLDKTIVIATTNYPEDLPGNIVERPSRFDRLIHIKNPDRGEISEIVRMFTKQTPDEAEVDLLYSYSTAAIKEICLLSLIQQVSLSRAVEILKNRSTNISKTFSKNSKKGIGFSR